MVLMISIRGSQSIGITTRNEAYCLHFTRLIDFNDLLMSSQEFIIKLLEDEYREMSVLMSWQQRAIQSQIVMFII